MIAWMPWRGWGRRMLTRHCFCLLHFFLLVPAPLLCFLLHLMDPLEEPVWPDHFRAADPHHVVSRMLPCSFTPTAEVVVVANHALVSKSCNRVLAPIASDPRVEHARPSRLLLLLFNPLCLLESEGELIDRAWHRG